MYKHQKNIHTKKKHEKVSVRHREVDTLLISSDNLLKQIVDLTEFVGIDINNLKFCLRYDMKKFFEDDKNKQAKTENKTVLEAMKIFLDIILISKESLQNTILENSLKSSLLHTEVTKDMAVCFNTKDSVFKNIFLLQFNQV